MKKLNKNNTIDVRLKKLEREVKELKKEVSQTPMDNSISDVVRSRKTGKIIAFRNEKPMPLLK